MALTNILYKKKPNEIGSIVLDATISENHDFSSLVTKYPIEKGADISDNIINNPVKLTMTGFITNSPVNIFGDFVDRATQGQKLLPNRVGAAFTELTDLREIKEPFTVVSGLKTYQSMVFESLVFPRDRSTGDTLRFTAVLTRLRKAESRKIERQNLDPGTTEAKENTKDLAAEKVDKGAQTTTEAETQRVSILKRAVSGISGFFTGSN